MRARDLHLKKVVLLHYKKHKRSLPWRNKNIPYNVFVSEYMLQQTQVERVIPKFNVFIKRFPNFNVLSHASLPEVFALWQGLGYNRRAKYLRDAAKRIVEEKKGILPNDQLYLESLPGVGPYTAGAIRAFAFGSADSFIETNIRTVILHHFFKDKKDITDLMILTVLKKLEPKAGKASQEWYAALMDYGSYLKRGGVKLNPSSAHYTKQKKFAGSSRELRGMIMRFLLVEQLSFQNLIRKTKRKPLEVREELQRLEKEQLVQKRKNNYALTN